MKIWLVCSKVFYKNIEPIKIKLEELGHEVELPNSYDNPNVEKESWELGEKEHAAFKKRMFNLSRERAKDMDAVLALNFEKNSKKDYIGGATFLELYEAFMQDKKVYLYNDIPEGMLYDEICGFSPIVIKGDLNKIK